MEKENRPTKSERSDKTEDEVRTCIKGLGFCSFASDANVSAVDVKDGKIIRIRPLHYDWKYKPSEFRPWKIKARDRHSSPACRH